MFHRDLPVLLEGSQLKVDPHVIVAQTCAFPPLVPRGCAPKADSPRVGQETLV